MLNQGGHFYVCGSARQVPEDIYTAMKEAGRTGKLGCSVVRAINGGRSGDFASAVDEVEEKGDGTSGERA